MPLYSYSRIGCFENCPRQYKFKYIEKPDIETPEGIEAFMGGMAHKALEQCYRLAQTGRVMTADELTAYYRRVWEENRPEKLRIVKTEMTEDDYLNIGTRALEMYHARYAPFDQELTLGLERKVAFSLDPEGKYKIQGYIDRLTRDTAGRLRIQDYKTSSTLPAQPEIDADNQLALYQIAVDEMWPDNNGIELVWHYLQFDTTMVSHRDHDQLEKIRLDYIEKIRMLERAVELDNFPIRESNLCNWCEYYELCPAKGGKGVKKGAQETLEPLPASEIASLVDEYIDCYTEKKNLEKRMEDIQQRLKPSGVVGESIPLKGTAPRELILTLSKIPRLPTKTVNSSAVERIRQFVIEAGLWDKFGSLNIVGLQKAYTDGSLPEPLMEKLREFERMEIQTRFRIKQK